MADEVDVVAAPDVDEIVDLYGTPRRPGQLQPPGMSWYRVRVLSARTEMGFRSE